MQAEWVLLEQLARRNPGRLSDLKMQDSVLNVMLRDTPAFALEEGSSDAAPEIVRDHGLRIEFPPFFPAAPMEMYLERAMQHPNIHPETGFICLWERHRVTNTVQHALHKTVAILGWQLHNRQPLHVMQPDALRRLETEGEARRRALAVPALTGSASPDAFPSLVAEAARPARRRLS